MEFSKAESIREAVVHRFPDVNDDEFSIEHSGFVHDHPMIPISVVLISSIVLDTTDPVKIAQFTKYSELFVRAIANNMKNAGLWKENKYDCSSWFSGELVPHGETEKFKFWQHVLIAEGSQWHPHTDKNMVQNSSLIFWDDMLHEAKARGIMLWRSGKRVV